jgi:hypothetical protein
MQDGVAFFTLNDQGGPRGERDTDFDVQNWWMGMASRPAAGGTIQFNVMFSLEPAMLGSDGYREIQSRHLRITRSTPPILRWVW